jgi:hypothetical protein
MSIIVVFTFHLKFQMYMDIERLKTGHRSWDRMVVGFKTTCAISAYHH